MVSHALLTLLTALGVLGVGATLLPYSGSKAWWVRIWDFPRPQVAAANAVALLGLVALRGVPDAWSAGFIALLAACILWQARRILPYTWLWRRQMVRAKGPPGERTVSILVVNVLMTNRRLDGLLASFAATDPDLVLAVETDPWWTEELSRALPEHRFRVPYPLDNTYGITLLSRLELERPVVRFLLTREIPSIRARVRLRSGEPILLYALHPEPPSPTEAESSLERDAELVLVGREIAASPEPAIVAGDLNDVAWSHTSRLFQRLSGLLDPRIGRGLYSTFHARWPGLRWPLDHVFASREFLLRDIRRLPGFGSDHFPILAVFDHVPTPPPDNAPPQAEPLDHIEAHWTLRKAGARAATPRPPG